MWEIDITASSRKGAKHNEKQGNQDRFMISSPLIPSPNIGEKDYQHFLSVNNIEDLKIIAGVSDGISSTPRAGDAAQRVLLALNELWENDVPPEKWCIQINARIRNEFFSWETCENLGAATLSYIVFRNGKIYPVNVGDSPIYLLRNNELISLYEEQTVLVRDFRGRERNALGKYIGNPNYITVPQEHIGSPITPCHGDVFLICTDGLVNGLKNRTGCDRYLTLKNMMADKDKKADRLRAKAKKKSADDITAILIRIL